MNSIKTTNIQKIGTNRQYWDTLSKRKILSPLTAFITFLITALFLGCADGNSNDSNSEQYLQTASYSLAKEPNELQKLSMKNIVKDAATCTDKLKSAETTIETLNIQLAAIGGKLAELKEDNKSMNEMRIEYKTIIKNNKSTNAGKDALFKTINTVYDEYKKDYEQRIKDLESLIHTRLCDSGKTPTGCSATINQISNLKKKQRKTIISGTSTLCELDQYLWVFTQPEAISSKELTEEEKNLRPQFAFLKRVGKKTNWLAKIDLEPYFEIKEENTGDKKFAVLACVVDEISNRLISDLIEYHTEQENKNGTSAAFPLYKSALNICKCSDPQIITINGD